MDNSATSYEKLPNGYWGLVKRPRCEQVGTELNHGPWRCSLAGKYDGLCGNHWRLRTIRELRAKDRTLSFADAAKQCQLLKPAPWNKDAQPREIVAA